MIVAATWLRQVKPPVWRRIEVASNIEPSKLSEVLGAAMGWLGGHLHAFEADGVLYDVVVEAIEPIKSDAVYPVCLAGKRACPPDDCGGPWGYGNLLAAISDPKHQEHEELTEWMPPGLDPDGFDVAEATEMMRSARPLRDW